ncbi:MAG: thioredoxin-disulfide reductase [Candidatus Dadabacteria bacterium]|nr:thioredoxin-disulfide reductase [Candidatus Dadabacteria bacterium]
MIDKSTLTKKQKVVIMGSGPAGLTAAIYTARANLEPLVFEGLEAGGQLTLTTDVENFPGFPEGIQGPALMNAMRQQAERFGATCLRERIDSVDFSERPFKVVSGDMTFEAETFIIASGASAKMLGIASEKLLLGRGVSTCATCDGFFYRDKEIIVVGGGDSAVEEGTFLTKFASKVNIIHRRDQLRASKIMQDRAFKNPKVDFIWNAEIEEILGDVESGVKGVVLRDTKTGETTRKDIDGIFIAIGHTPNTSIFKGKLDMDEVGYLITKEGSTETNVPGVFAAGDVRDNKYRQAITAAGSGCMAAIDAEKFLESQGE